MFKTFFSKNGRIGRFKFWISHLFVIFVMFCSIVALCSFDEASDAESLTPLISIILFISSNFSLMMVSIKRLHDFNLTGWWLFVGLVFPPVLFVLWIMMLFRAGTHRINDYG